MFGFESIRPSPSFLPRRSTPSARLPSRPAPLPLHFGAFSFPPRRGGVETILTARAGRGVGGTRCVMQISQLLIGWRRASGGGAGVRRRSTRGGGQGESPCPAASPPPLLPPLAPQPRSPPRPPGEAPPHPHPPARPPVGALRPFTPGGWASPASAAAAAVAEEAREDLAAAAAVAGSAAAAAAAATSSLCRGIAARALGAVNPTALGAA